MMRASMKAHRLRWAAALTLGLATPWAQAVEVAGVSVPDSTHLAGKELLLNGAGVRSKLLIKVYVGALYVAEKTGSAAAVLEAPAPQRISLRLLRDLDAASLQEALDEGLRNNLSAAELAAQAGPAEQLARLMKSLGRVREIGRAHV